MKVGDLVKYMSRTILIIGACPNDAWVFGIECGETAASKYLKSALKVISEGR